MKAFIVNRYSKKDKLQLVEIPVPVIQDNDVLIQIHAAGVNVLDSKIKSGEFKMILHYKTPFTLGHDVAGIITQVGKKVRKFKIGNDLFFIVRYFDQNCTNSTKHLSTDLIQKG